MGIFTREKEELLTYDADAFFYFALTMLTMLVIPWTWVLVQRILNPRPAKEVDFDRRGPGPEGLRVRRCATSAMETRRQAYRSAATSWRSRLGGSTRLQLVAVALLWCCLGMVILRLKDTPTELRSFDPYEILGLDRSAELSQIKKAYRRQSLETHPDKNPDNPLAPVQFQQVAKAYAALTDEAGRRNYAKYGNPDGPTQRKVGIALHPALLVSKESQRLTLIAFFLMLFVPPSLVVCCCLRGSNLSAGGVSGETIRIFNACIDSEVTAEDGPGLLSASVEARRLVRLAAGDVRPLVKAMAELKPEPFQPETLVEVRGGTQLVGRRGVIRAVVSDLVCKVEVWPADGKPPPAPQGPNQLPTGVELRELPRKCLAVAQPRVPCPFSDPPIRRNTLLIWAHMWRLRKHMSAELQAELDAVLQQSVPVGRAMIRAAATHVKSGAFDVTCALIHFRQCLTQALDLGASPLLQLPHVGTVPPKSPELREVVSCKGDLDALAKFKFSAEQRLDVEAFCRHAPLVEISCHVSVPDEDSIAERDLAQLEVKLVRTNLEVGELVGPVNAPLFPCPKFEEWWILVYDNRSRALITADCMRGTRREETCTVRFMVPRAGAYHWTVHAKCDSYLGLDVSCPLEFTALKHDEVDHEVFIHPEDAHIKSFFEELMEGLNPEQPDEDSSDDESPPQKPQQEQQSPPTNGAAGADDAEDAEEDGVFFKVASTSGAPMFRRPCEDDELRVGTLPCRTIVRGFAGGDRPNNWVELPGLNSAWFYAGPEIERLGTFREQQLRTIVQTTSPLSLVRRWLKLTTSEIGAEDVKQVLEIEETGPRMLVEEMVRERVGDEQYEVLLAEVNKQQTKWRQRIAKARGLFLTQAGGIMRVTPDGAVQALMPDGSRSRHKIEVSGDDKIQIGPLRLDETKSCSCIHWLRQDDPSKQMVWRKDMSLRSKVRIGTAF